MKNSSFVNYNYIGGPPINPPEPDYRMMVVCEGCGEGIHIDNADNVGSELTPVFVCLDSYSCMKTVAEFYVAEALTRRA